MKRRMKPPFAANDNSPYPLGALNVSDAARPTLDAGTYHRLIHAHRQTAQHSDLRTTLGGEVRTTLGPYTASTFVLYIDNQGRPAERDHMGRELPPVETNIFLTGEWS